MQVKLQQSVVESSVQAVPRTDTQSTNTDLPQPASVSDKTVQTDLKDEEKWNSGLCNEPKQLAVDQQQCLVTIKSDEQPKETYAELSTKLKELFSTNLNTDGFGQSSGNPEEEQLIDLTSSAAEESKRSDMENRNQGRYICK